jgi:hypothetical protein
VALISFRYVCSHVDTTQRRRLSRQKCFFGPIVAQRPRPRFC